MGPSILFLVFPPFFGCFGLIMIGRASLYDTLRQGENDGKQVLSKFCQQVIARKAPVLLITTQLTALSY
jgi:hypothetical protein